MRLKFPNTPPFKPDKERFIKSQEFRLESSELKSLSHLGRKGVWGKKGDRGVALNIWCNKLTHSQKKTATGLNPNFPNTSNTLKTPEDPETLRTLKAQRASEGN